MFLSESRGFENFWFRILPDVGDDGEGLYRNGTYEVFFIIGEGGKSETWLQLNRNAENFGLEKVSFVFESGSKNECDVAPALKDLTKACKG